MNGKIKESEFIDPKTPLGEIPEGELLYVINLSTGNVIIPLDNRNITLNATGQEGSVQVVDKSVLKTPGVSVLWHAHRIGVSKSPNIGQYAVSEIEFRERAEREKMAEVVGSVEKVEGNGYGGVDVSDLAEDYTQDMVGIDPGIVQEAQDEPEVQVEDAFVVDEKPAKATRGKGRGRKTTATK